MSLVQRFEKNESGRDFVVGDIHGCFSQLHDVMRKADFKYTADRLFSVGDLVDRGPQSLKVSEWLEQPWFHAVRGNHEQMAIEAAYGLIDAGLHVVNGGLWFYEAESCDRDKAVKAMGKLPMAMEIATDNGKVGIVHAEVPGDNWTAFLDALATDPLPNFEHYERFALWGRDLIRGRSPFSGVAGIDLVVVGHTPVKESARLWNVLYLDTGCCFGRHLTMVCIQGGQFGEEFTSGIFVP